MKKQNLNITKERQVNRKSSNKLLVFVVVIIFIAGAGLLLYPFVSSVINSAYDAQLIDDYKVSVSRLDENKVKKMLDEAKEYNKHLRTDVVLTDPFDPDAMKNISNEEYMRLLKMDDTDIMAYVDYPDLGIYLPVYHTANDDVLSKGAGHLENTSLPVGGKGTHSVISAHTAFSTQTFFDNLTSAKEGDTFYIHVLDKTLAYQVDSIKVVLPTKTKDLKIVEDKDYVTLLTCTPYSVNSHRLLVRGKRIPYTVKAEQISNETSRITTSRNGGIYLYGLYISMPVIIGIISVVVIAVVFIVIFFVKKSKKTVKNKGDADET